MVSTEMIERSNALLHQFSASLVAIFLGATSGIGQSALQQLASHAPSPRVYSIVRPSKSAAHSEFLASLRKINPSGTYTLITAEVSLISEIDRVAELIKQKETKIDILFMSPGFMPFPGRVNTSEGLDPSMTLRCYSRLRAAKQLLPLLNSPEATSPRIISVLAAGYEAPINEDDLDLAIPANWSFWNASTHSATMGTLAFEKLAKENPRLSIVHWCPGVVDTPGLKDFEANGLDFPVRATEEDAGKRGLFVATSDRFAVGQGGLVPMVEGMNVVGLSRGGIFLVDEKGEGIDQEDVLSGMRYRGLDEVVWKSAEKVFASTETRKGELHGRPSSSR